MGDGQYDDAWETVGWTSQNMAYPDTPPEGTAPAGLRKVKVTGGFFDDRGKGAHGKVTFTPSVKAVQIEGAYVLLRTISETVTAGNFRRTTYLTFPDETVPQVWYYDVRERIGPLTRTYKVYPPAADIDTVSLASISADIDADESADLPLTRDITVVPGATFRRSFVWLRGEGYDYTTWTARLQVRNTFGGTLLLELTKDNGITLGGAGEIQYVISAEQTEDLASGVYDLELYEPGGDTVRFLQGTVTRGTPNVTE